MSELPATLLHFRLLEKIGEGGMGEVWRAIDTTLDREVALKLLPAAFVADPERLARFEREAKVLASLNHPNIAAIHGLHDDHGLRFLSMELVPGEDLSKRLERSALGVTDTVEIATKIAEALEYAHERGIVHRDLKPANIKLTPDREVKVLDFGLAKALTSESSMGGSTTTPTVLPTVTSAGTAMGLILGTAAYMSPEQARGKPVDRRADIWSFGVVLFEMLSGRRAFDGETITDVLAAVVTRDPDWSALPAATPAALRRLLARCLDKNPKTRLRDVGEARVALSGPMDEEPAPAGEGAASRSSRPRWLAITGIAAIALALGAGSGRWLSSPSGRSRLVFEFDVTVPGERIESGSIALSPDGSRLAMVTHDATGDRHLCVRKMDSADARDLAGTSGALFPFWSPDGLQIGYFSNGELLRVGLDNAAPQVVGAVPTPLGGTWGAGDVILVGSTQGPITKMSLSGGTPQPVTIVEKGVEETHVWPAFLPDGKHFIFLSDASSEEGHRIYLASLDGGKAKILRKGLRSQPILDPAGRILVVEQGQLVAYTLDAARGEMSTTATVIAPQVFSLGTDHLVPASVAANGAIAYQQGTPEVELVVFDMSGRVTRTIGSPDRFGNPTISPDGKRVAFEVFTNTTERLVWVQDIAHGVRTPISKRGFMADSATWSPDGESLYFDSNAAGKWQVFRGSISGGGDPETIGMPEGATDIATLAVSHDGHWLLAAAQLVDSRNDLYLRPLGAPAGKWIPWATGPFDEDRGNFSPDSRWITYSSDASGRVEIYVAPLEGGPSVHRWQVSAGGGYEPRFTPDGKSILYRSAANEWISVPIDLSHGKLEAGSPKILFPAPQVDLPWTRNLGDVLPDGSGIVTLRPHGNREMAVRVRTGQR